MGWPGCGTTTSMTRGTRWTRKRSTCSPQRFQTPQAVPANIIDCELFTSFEFVSSDSGGNTHSFTVHLYELQPPDLDAGGSNPREVVVCLLGEPTLGAAPEDPG